jgi:hypothetical protein
MAILFYRFNMGDLDCKEQVLHKFFFLTGQLTQYTLGYLSTEMEALDEDDGKSKVENLVTIVLNPL